MFCRLIYKSTSFEYLSTEFLVTMEIFSHSYSADYEQRRDQDGHTEVDREDDLYGRLVQNVDDYRLPFYVRREDQN